MTASGRLRPPAAVEPAATGEPGGGPSGTSRPGEGELRAPGSVGVADLAAGAAFRLPALAVGLSTAMVVASVLLSVTMGPLDLGWRAIVADMVDRLPYVELDSGLSQQEQAIVWQWRLPRAVLGALVGAALALSGATYQGVFRNPLADPYLLGVAAGAGLGATLAIASGIDVGWGPFGTIPAAAFVGALLGVAMATALGWSPGSTPATLVVAGVAVASFLTAAQTYVMQRNSDDLRQVYTWILGRVATSGWGDVAVLGPYVVGCGTAILLLRRQLDVLRLGDDEASSLGVDPRRVRAALVVAASLLAAAAVSVSGLISFVGIIVPHLVRLMVGASYRIVLPLSALGGAAFLMGADLLARTVASPAELPIGVVTAFCGAPFFGLVLWTTRKALL